MNTARVSGLCLVIEAKPGVSSQPGVAWNALSVHHTCCQHVLLFVYRNSYKE